ncbi:MAG TPA: DUF1572 family protein [Pyrinomonadaceae bacterium]|nr:DUF1572 family protein [Pyrinomonadaceae bacterium]
MHYLDDALLSFRNYKSLAEKAIEQVTDEEFFYTIDPESNSIAIIVKHVAGNLHSRWRSFLTTDGEKPDRNRDGEFIVETETRQDLMTFWESGWQELFKNLEPLTEEDFEKKVTIRGQEHSIVEAINRQLTHYAYHVGQIVFLAKHFRSAEWKTLSIPKNRSGAYNQFLSNHQTDKSATADRFAAAEQFNANLDNPEGNTKS